MIILGLTGPAGCGKSTAAAHLVEDHGFAELQFAEPIRRAIAAIMGIELYELEYRLQNRTWKEGPHKLLGYKSPRYAMQTLGTEWGRDLIHPGLWVRRVDRLIARAAEIEEPKSVVISDVRFPNEAALVRRLGTLMHIKRADIAAVSAHSSESGIAPECGDAFITNTDIPALCRELDNWVLSETGGEPE